MKTELSEKLFAKAQTLFPGGVNSPVRAFKGVGGTPRFIARGRGSHLFDVDGNEYVDYVLSLGAAHRRSLPRRGDARGAGRDARRLVLRRALAPGDPARRARPGADALGREDAVLLLGHRGHHRRHPGGARLHRARRHPQVRRLLPRRGRHPAREGGLGRRDARPAGLAGRARRPREAHPHAPVQRPRRGAEALRPARPRDRGGDRRAGRRQHGGPRPEARLSPGPARRLPRERCAAHHRRGDDRVPRRLGRRLRPLRPAAGPRHVRQGDRRGPSGGRLRRARGRHGSRRAGGPHLPGGHALREPDGDGGGSRDAAPHDARGVRDSWSGSRRASPTGSLARRRRRRCRCR